MAWVWNSAEALMLDDFPAAHSMDTVWFAVDKDGHVGCFWSGEAGAVPVGAATGEQVMAGSQVEQQLLASLPPCDVVFDPQGRTLGPELGGGPSHFDGDELPCPALMFLESLTCVEQDLQAEGGTVVGATSGVAVLWRSLSRPLFQRLHEAGLCLGCFYYVDTKGSDNLARRGVFYYNHLTDNWIAGPYGRSELPARPIHVDELPPAVRQQVKRTRFEGLCFTDTPHIQPLEHGNCECWEGAYVDVTGKHIRPVPGREGDYADRYNQLTDYKAEFDVESPPTETEEPNE
jgi:hypothetical protein